MLDLEKLGEAKWAQYGQDKDEEAYLVKFVSDERARQILSKNGIEPDKVLEKIDDPDVYMLLIHEAVQDWKGIYKSEGKPLPCNEANRDLVFKEFRLRAMFVLGQCRSEKLFMGEPSKNSQASSATK